MRSVGVVVNPIAGMGGRVGLKGTDEKLEEARRLGAEPRAPGRAVRALKALGAMAADLKLLTYGGDMGEREARKADLRPGVVGEPSGEETTASDTRAAVEAFAERSVDVVLFVGGDGTAVDVAEALADHDGVPMLGVPAGVKVYSAVFAVDPEAAGRVAATFSRTERREVSDIDEAAYREGELRAEPKAVATVPVADGLQTGKATPGGTVESLARGVADDVRSGVTCVFGPGGTVGEVERELGFEGSPLGVDVYRDGELTLRDGAEHDILAALGEHNQIVVSPVGGEGFLFGRGNDQLSPAVIRRCELTIVASQRKLDDIGALRVDTGDPGLDEELAGWHRVRVGRYEHRLVEIV